MSKIAGVPIFSRAFIKWVFVFLKSVKSRYRKFDSLLDLTYFHFKTWSNLEHQMYKNFSLIQSRISVKPTIVETGTSAWGCDSSRLFDKLAHYLNGNFYSVDIRKEASEWLNWQTYKSSQFYVDDSLHFLRFKLSELAIEKIDLLYLDSFDLDLVNPFPSMKHTLEEFIIAEQYFKSGTFIMIDDSPINLNYYKKDSQLAQIFFDNHGLVPGKGSLVLEYIKKSSSYNVIEHNSQIVLEFK